MTQELVGRPMEILLVEDNLADAGLTIEALRRGKIRHRMTVVRDGEEALEFLHCVGRFARAPRPDLILLDLNLPKIDGRELLAQLHGEEQLREIPVVILTSSVHDEQLLRNEYLQVESYLIKPVDVQRFLAVVEELKRFWHADMILPAMNS
jgi:chemotaxis family two-component system response regulator Rcp1